jgi:hypothetical protein
MPTRGCIEQPGLHAAARPAVKEKEGTPARIAKLAKCDDRPGERDRLRGLHAFSLRVAQNSGKVKRHGLRTACKAGSLSE